MKNYILILLLILPSWGQSPVVLLFGKSAAAGSSLPPIAGYTGWWVADYGLYTNVSKFDASQVAAVNDGQSVRQWRDKAGTNDLYTLNSAGTAGIANSQNAIVLTNSAINGHPGVWFNDPTTLTRFITPQTNRVPMSGSGFTIFAVGSAINSNVSQVAFAVVAGFNDGGRWDVLRRNNTANQLQAADPPGTGSVNSYTNYNQTSNYVWGVTFTNTTHWFTVSQNGLTTNRTAGSSSAGTTNLFAIGGYAAGSPSSSQYWKGYICEVLYYGTPLSIADFNTTLGYFTNKYNLKP